MKNIKDRKRERVSKRDEEREIETVSMIVTEKKAQT